MIAWWTGGRVHGALAVELRAASTTSVGIRHSALGIRRSAQHQHLINRTSLVPFPPPSLPTSHRRAMPRSHPRTRPSRMALMMSLFFLNALATETTSSTPPRSLARRDSWRPDTELPGAKFVLGDGKTEGVKAKGYQGEWPLWSGFRNGQASDKPVASSSGSQPAVAAGNASDYVCVAAGDCNPCPDDVVSTSPGVDLFADHADLVWNRCIFRFVDRTTTGGAWPAVPWRTARTPRPFEQPWTLPMQHAMRPTRQLPRCWAGKHAASRPSKKPKTTLK